eukprot:680880-Amphidinium_carterae.1
MMRKELKGAVHLEGTKRKGNFVSGDTEAQSRNRWGPMSAKTGLESSPRMQAPDVTESKTKRLAMPSPGHGSGEEMLMHFKKMRGFA